MAFLFPGILFFLLRLYTYTNGVAVDGVVSGHQQYGTLGCITYHPVLTYKDETENRHQFTFLLGSVTRNISIGTKFTIRYLNGWPEFVYVDSLFCKLPRQQDTSKLE
jgi:hypothetical protein